MIGSQPVLISVNTLKLLFSKKVLSGSSSNKLRIKNLSTLAMANTTDPTPSYPNLPRRDVRKRHVVLVGLNFGPTSLSITFFTDRSEYYTGIPCGELYKSFWQDALSKEVQCNFECASSEGLSTSAVSSFTSHEKFIELVESFSGHIKSAINMGVSALDNNPALTFKLIAVTVPDHWDGSARTHVATATKLAGQPLDGSYMIIPLSRAIQSAFQMSRYTKDKYLTLFFDYNKSYLHMILVAMCGTGCIVKRQVYFPYLGEDELHKAPNGLQNDGKSKDHSIVVPDKFITQRPICNNKAAHFKPIVDTVSEFMIRMTVPTSGPTVNLPVSSYLVSDLRHAVRDVRYIVIDGEASTHGLWDLRDAIKSKFVNEEWINVKGDKRDCGAYGAALVARRQWQNPKHFGDWKDLPGYVRP